MSVAPVLRDGVRLRTRYIDDALREAVKGGFDQFVLLGAGFDARALRMPELAPKRVFEIDAPSRWNASARSSTVRA
ncbi:MAG TPA: class I SAM-dependent methyltransferase [Polyangiaceae bacterium]